MKIPPSTLAASNRLLQANTSWFLESLSQPGTPTPGKKSGCSIRVAFARISPSRFLSKVLEGLVVEYNDVQRMIA